MIQKGKNLKLTKFEKRNGNQCDDEDIEYERSTVNKELVKCDKEIKRRDRRSRLQDLHRKVDLIEVNQPIAEEEEEEKCENANLKKPNSNQESLLSRRRQLLDIWRQERKEKLISCKMQQKPIFKVQHCNPKEYELSNVSVTCGNSSSIRPYNLRSFSCSDINKKADHSRFNFTVSNSSRLKGNQMFQFGAPSNCTVKSKFTFSASINNLTTITGNNPKPLPQNRQKRTVESVQSVETSKPPRLVKPLHPPPPAPTSTRYPRRKCKAVNDISPKDVDNIRNCLSSTRIEPPNLKELGIDVDPINEIDLTDDADHQPIAKESRKLFDEIFEKKTFIESYEQDKLRDMRSAISDMRRTSLRLFKETQLQLSVPQKDDKIETIEEEPSVSISEVKTESIISQENNLILKTQENNKIRVNSPSPIKDVKQKKALQKDEKIDTVEIKTSVSISEVKIGSIMNHGDNLIRQTEENIKMGVNNSPIKDSEEREYLKATAFYRNLVVEKTNSLNSESDRWAGLCEKKIGEGAPEHVEGEIRLACGLAKLLIDERFSQFSELIDQCEQSNSATDNLDPEVKLVKPTDLEGFWEMIYAQVINVEKLFAKLEKLRLNNFVEVEEAPKPKKVPLKAVIKKPNATETGEKKNNPEPVKKPIRSRFADFRKNLDKQNKEVVNNDVLALSPQIKNLNPIIIKVKTPVIEPVTVKTPVIEPVTVKTPVTEPEMVKTPLTVPVTVKSPVIDKVKIDIDNVLLNEKENVESKEEKIEIREIPSYKSRVSDLIKFDSPQVTRRQSKRLTAKTNLVNENKFVRKVDLIEENEGNCSADDSDDMFGDLEYKVHWKSKKNTETPPKNYRTKNQQDNLTCSAGVFKNISNSPLLKLAIISSHGKRSSLAGGRPSLNFN